VGHPDFFPRPWAEKGVPSGKKFYQKDPEALEIQEYKEPLPFTPFMHFMVNIS